MTEEELDCMLRMHTASEDRHLKEGAAYVSEHYRNIDKVLVDGREVYHFTFKHALADSNFFITKESRFTEIFEHVHEASELLYVYSGHCTQIVDGRGVPMQKGDLCILDRNVVHSIEQLDEDDIAITIVMRKEYLEHELLGRLGEGGIINSFIADAISERAEHDSFYVMHGISEKARHHIRQILCEYFDRNVYGREMVAAEMVLLFCELLRQFRDTDLRADSSGGTETLRILRYIEQNYTDITLKQTAEQFGFSPTYLSERIHHNTGRTFKKLVVLQRMSAAYFRIANSSDAIADIAAEVGYANLSYFYRKFEETYGFTPGDVRRLAHIRHDTLA